MESIAISELRANLMQILKRIESGATISITSRGRIIARLVPPEDKMSEAHVALAELRKTAVVGDILSPIDEEWKALK
jgi:prevent-host-death family protein